MKILLFDVDIPRDLQMKYLETMNIPYFLYEYQKETAEYVKVDSFKRKLYEREDYISLLDKGDRYPSERNNGFWTEGAYKPDKSMLRYDDTLISIIENNPKFERKVRIAEVEPGQRYRFTRDEYDREDIDVFENLDWIIA